MQCLSLFLVDTVLILCTVVNYYPSYVGQMSSVVSVMQQMDGATYLLMSLPEKITTSSSHYTGASGSLVAVAMETTPLWPSLVCLHIRAHTHKRGTRQRSSSRERTHLFTGRDISLTSHALTMTRWDTPLKYNMWANCLLCYKFTQMLLRVHEGRPGFINGDPFRQFLMKYLEKKTKTKGLEAFWDQRRMPRFWKANSQ